MKKEGYLIKNVRDVDKQYFTMLREGYDPPISRSLKAMNAIVHSINPMSLAP